MHLILFNKHTKLYKIQNRNKFIDEYTMRQLIELNGKDRNKMKKEKLKENKNCQKIHLKMMSL